MKKVRNAVALMMLFFCAHNISAQTKTLHWLDLSPAGIKASIQVPVDVKIIPDDYDVLIGDGKSIKIQITKTSRPFAETVSFTEKNDIRKFVKFIQKEPNGYIAQLNPMFDTEYDFAWYTTLGNTNYLLQDVGSIRHPNLKLVKEMYTYAQTLKTN